MVSFNCNWLQWSSTQPKQTCGQVRTTEPYLSLTVHFIDDDFELKSRCLQTPYFPQDHKGGNIASGLREALAALDLCEECQVAITTDYNYKPSIIIKAVQLNNWQRFHCFGHRLHLAIGKLILSTILHMAYLPCVLFLYLFFICISLELALWDQIETALSALHSLKQLFGY